jgi:hypothetical protein
MPGLDVLHGKEKRSVAPKNIHTVYMTRPEYFLL